MVRGLLCITGSEREGGVLSLIRVPLCFLSHYIALNIDSKGRHRLRVCIKLCILETWNQPPVTARILFTKIIYYLNCIFLFYVHLFLLSYFKIIIWGNGYHDCILLNFVYADLNQPPSFWTFIQRPSFLQQPPAFVHCAHSPLPSLHST